MATEPVKPVADTWAVRMCGCIVSWPIDELRVAVCPAHEAAVLAAIEGHAPGEEQG